VLRSPNIVSPGFGSLSSKNLHAIICELVVDQLPSAGTEGRQTVSHKPPQVRRGDLGSVGDRSHGSVI